MSVRSPRRYSGGGVDHRKVAKVGMTVALAAVMVTGYMNGRTARRLHTASAYALVGFSLYHHALYN